MKVLHVGPTPFFSDRGCHVRIRGLIRSLNSAGTENLLCTYHHGSDVEGVRTERSLRIPWYTKLDAGPSAWKYLADVFLFLRVWAAAIRWQPDVIHAHLHEGALIGWAAGRMLFWRRTPLVFDMQGSLVGELASHDYVGKAGPKRWLFRRLERFIDHRARHIVCSSRHSLEIARDRFGVPESRLTLVADGPDVGNPAASAIDGLRSELNLPTGRPVAIYTGSLLSIKGVDTLHELLREIHRRRLDLHMLLVGYPTDATRAYVDEHGLDGVCTLTGQVPYDRLAEYLALASMAIEPKASDSGEASGKVLNYMAARLPVVCFSTENNRSILGESGAYAASDSVESLADQLAILAADPDLARTRGEQAHVRVAQHFSWDASAAKLRDLYEQLTRIRS